jgi:glycyl-tRNA synthetase alpha chain
LEGLTFQDLIIRLSQYWAGRGCVLALPYDLEVGAGTMCPETFFRVLGPDPWRVAYVQPSRRPADGRYGENPNRLVKHTQLQVILKPPPNEIQDIYLESLESIGINLREHDVRFEEDNWESPTLGAWGVGWQVLLDGLEITQFTYFQQCGGVDLEPVSVELTYGLERIAAFLQNVSSVFDVQWNETRKYGELKLKEELELSVYDFEAADPDFCRRVFDLCEKEGLRLLGEWKRGSLATAQNRVDVATQKPAGSPDAGGATNPTWADPDRFPLQKVFELCLKCSHLFNILDARGAISVTERAGLIGRVRKLACRVAAIDVEQKASVLEAQPA